MRMVVQRVNSAVCTVDEEVTGEIEEGLLTFLGIGEDDDQDDLEYMVDKLLGLRIFSGSDQEMDLDIQDVNGGILMIPQFTLYGDVRRGRRPSFNEACSPERAEMLFSQFLDHLSERHDDVESGRFAEMMDIKADNDGPVTILVDSNKTF
jgi:D-tyrosyl-tRNA(Tyr) deacylase